jgi:hypothetical protein
MKIIVGKSGGHNVSIDLSVLLTTRALLTADSGGGKTFALKRICEQAKGKIQILIIDPEGEFAPLREKLDFVLVGKGGETPADVRSAGLVAQTLLKLRADAICDIYEMKSSERHAWVRTFIEALIEAPKETRHPCLVIVDEAHMFCPEHGKGESEAGDAMISLCTRGRKRLLCPLFATQRLATLSKDASSMLLNRMIGPTFEDINRKRAADVLGITKEDQKEFYKQIQTLEPGYFFCLGRAISRERILCHIGPIETPHGQEALRYEMKPPPAPDKIKALLPKLADLPKQAEEQAKTVAEFRAEIRSLKTQLRSQPVKQETKEIRVIDPRAIAAAVRPLSALLEEAMRVFVKINAIGFDNAALKPEEIQKALDATAKEISALAKARLVIRASEFERLKGEANRLLAKLSKLLDEENIEIKLDVQKNEPITVTQRERQRPMRQQSQPIAIGDEQLTPYQVDILRGLAELESIGKENVTLALAGVAAGKSAKSSTFERYRAKLQAIGLVSYPMPGRIALTDEGRKHAPSNGDAALTSEDIQDRARRLLTPYQADLLSALISVHPRSLTREDLGHAANKQPGSSTFERYLASLRSMELVEYAGAKMVKCADWLFVD